MLRLWIYYIHDVKSMVATYKNSCVFSIFLKQRTIKRFYKLIYDYQTILQRSSTLDGPFATNLLFSLIILLVNKKKLSFVVVV